MDLDKPIKQHADSDIQRQIKLLIESTMCITHGKTAVINSITGTKLNLSYCCDDLRTTLEQKLKD